MASPQTLTQSGGCRLGAEPPRLPPGGALVLLLWDLVFEISVPSWAAGSLPCPTPARVKDTLFLPATAAGEINAATANGLSLSAAGLLPARAAWLRWKSGYRHPEPSVSVGAQ